MPAAAAGAAAGSGSGSGASSAAQAAGKSGGLASGLDFGGNMLWNMVSAVQARRSQRRSQKFAEHMFGTRFQKTVRDLQKAGLNPMLAYMSSQPAASGGGAAVGSFGKSDSAVKGFQARKMAEQINSMIDYNSAAAAKQRADASLSVKKLDEVQATIEKLQSDRAVNSAVADRENHMNTLRGIKSGLWKRVKRGIDKWDGVIKNINKPRDIEEKFLRDMEKRRKK